MLNRLCKQKRSKIATIATYEWKSSFIQTARFPTGGFDIMTETQKTAP